jgi:hypothetical protein
MSVSAQLAIDFDRLPRRRPKRDVDRVKQALVRQQQRALDAALRTQQGAAPCACPTPLDSSEGRCVKCGRETTR